MSKVGSMSIIEAEKKRSSFKSKKFLNNVAQKLQKSCEMLDLPPGAGKNNTGKKSEHFNNIILAQNVKDQIMISEHSSENENSSVQKD